MFHKIGDGSNVSAWFDNWHPIGPLCTVVSRRDVIQAGFSLRSTVVDFVSSNGWSWPDSWKERYACLFNFNPLALSNSKLDVLMWKLKDGSLCEFSVSNVWSVIRESFDSCSWVKLVWFSQCVPRHSFFVWLAIRNRLMTQDRLFFQVGFLVMVCPLCKLQADSHVHLYFECQFSAGVWEKMKEMSNLQLALNSLSLLLDFFQSTPINNSIWSIIQRLVLGASIYFIWQERNSRLFKGDTR